MAHLNRFRIVKLSSELQKEFDLPKFICADPDGMSFPEGQTFYHWLIDENACEPVTAYNYLNVILPFLTFLQSHTSSLKYTAPAEQIRNRIRDYLRERLGCAVRPHPNGNFIVKSPKTITTTSTRLFLTALKRYYAFAILRGWYTSSNPLDWVTRLATLDREFIPKMPPQSGMTIPNNKRGRIPDTYFCVVSGDWQPHIIDDPNLPKLLLAAFSLPRDRLVTRILFESGARVGEVLGLRMGDWRSRELRERALATNKGSRGERVKEIWWSSTTAQLLRNYINQDRRYCDLMGRKLDDLPNSTPLFITEDGKPYTYADFYFHWQRACKRANLKITPHQARHWFVTTALRKFRSLPNDQQESARQALIAYIGWKNPETIKAYDHHIRKMDFGPTHAALARLIEDGDHTSIKPKSNPTQIPTIPDEMWKRISQLVDGE